MKRLIIGIATAALLSLTASLALADRTTTIWISKNDDLTSPIKCTASTVNRKMVVRRKEPIRWKIRNDADNPCQSFAASKVCLQFYWGVVGWDRWLCAKPNGQLDARVADNKFDAGDGAYLYTVYYDEQLAEDPELDVKGDMLQ